MDTYKEIHLEKPNTLANFLSKEEREKVVSLKLTGVLGRKDFDKVLDGMCELEGIYDDDDNFVPWLEYTAALRHLDMGEATYVDGDELPYFGYHTQLETLILPKGIKSTLEEEEDATGISESESLQSLVLPEGLKIVGGFNSCNKLTGVVLPEGLEVIAWHAFCGCDCITSIRIPASVKKMYGNCFAGCNIKGYEVDESNAYYTAIDGVIYSKDLSTLVAFPSAYPSKHFVVPNTTRVIGDSAFMCSQIESIELPNGLSTIEEWSFQCSKIHSIEIPNSVTEIGELSFRFCDELESVKLPNTIKVLSSQLFLHCSKLETIQIPASVEQIRTWALWTHNLKKVTMEGSIPPKVRSSRDGDSIRKDVEIYVPKGALQAYKDALDWKFYKVKEV